MGFTQGQRPLVSLQNARLATRARLQLRYSSLLRPVLETVGCEARVSMFVDLYDVCMRAFMAWHR